MIRNMRLKTKLILAFSPLAAMVGGAGGFGLWYIHTVTKTSEVFSGVAAPMLNETMTLMNSLQAIHVALLEIFDLQTTEHHQAYASKLAEFDSTFHDGLKRLSQFAIDGGLKLNLAAVVTTQRAFIQQAQQVLTLLVKSRWSSRTPWKCMSPAEWMRSLWPANVLRQERFSAHFLT